MEPMQWLTLIVFGLTILVVITNVIDSTLAALIGVAVMCWVGIMTEADAFKYVDWNVMAILVGIWIIAGYFGKSGVPSWLSIQALRLSGGRPGYLSYAAGRERRARPLKGGKNMPDLYATISDVPRDVQDRLAGVLEMRAADTQQREMLKSYFLEIEFPQDAEVLEIGCGTGAVTRALAQWPRVGKAIGVDPSAIFVSKAKSLSTAIANISFKVADGKSLPCDTGAFDVVVVHTTLCHVPEPEKLLAEAARVLRSRGWLAIFDGDYATATVSTAGDDPLKVCVDAFRRGFVHDPWLVRRLPSLIAAAGLRVLPMRSHGYVEAPKLATCFRGSIEEQTCSIKPGGSARNG